MYLDPGLRRDERLGLRMAFRTLDEAELQNKRALVRVDFNVPMQDGEVTDDTRLPAYAGEQMRLELEALDAALAHPERPVMGIVGGFKVSTKLELLRHLVTKLDKLAIGGGMANTFLYAQGHDVGASYCEKDLAETARDIIRFAGQNNSKLFLPLHIAVAEKIAPGAPARIRDVGSIDDD